MPAISVIVCTIRVQTLPCTVESLRRQACAEWELVVADQSQTSEIGDYLSTLSDARIRHLPLDSRGKSRALNAAIAASRGDVVTTTDDDCEAPSDWLSAIQAAFEKDEADLLFGPVHAPPGWTRAQGACPQCLIDSRRLVRWEDTAQGAGVGGIGANMSLARSAVEALGPFDPCLGPGAAFVPNGEETDYAYRALARGLRVLRAPIPAIQHTFGVRPGEQAEKMRQMNFAAIGAVHEKQRLGPHGPVARAHIDPLYRSLRRDVLTNLAKGRMRHLGVKRLRQMMRGRLYIRRHFTVDENALLVPKSSDVAPLLG